MARPGRVPGTRSSSAGRTGGRASTSKAYKQIAVYRSHCGRPSQAFLWGGKWELYISHSLPSGATSLVFSYNKVSLRLWHLLTHELRLITTAFFDALLKDMSDSREEERGKVARPAE